MRGAARLAVLLVLVLAVPVARAGNPLLPGVKGTDDRMRADSREYPWSAIGRLNKATGGHCTAAVVGAKTVLTAAHCVWNGRTLDWMPPGSLHFVAGWDRGDFLKHSRGAGLHVPEAYDPRTTASARNAQHDWALVTLRRAVAPATGKLGLADLDAAALTAKARAGTAFVQAGYSQDKAHVLTVHLGCPVRGGLKGLTLLAHGCDAVPGDSGAPILFWDGAGFRVAGIHVATARNADPVLGLAVPAHGFFAAAGPGRPEPGAGKPAKTVAALLGRLGYETLAAFSEATGVDVSAGPTAAVLGALIDGFAAAE